MKSRSLVLSTSAAFVLAAIGACGDDTTDGGGAGGEAASSSSAATTTQASASASTASASSASGTSTGTGTGGEGGGVGGGAGGEGGQGGSCIPDADFPVIDAPPALLSETGLYEQGSLDVDPRLRAYTPEFALWSDGLDKSRWVYVPECELIDTSNLDHWQFPVGTRFYKEFSLDGERIETRVIHRFRDDGDSGTDDWWYAAYQWTSETDAEHVPDGVLDANGTTHDIPSQLQCVGCHGYLPEKILGFGAVQLAHADGELTLDDLVDEGRLSAPPEIDIEIPALDPTERAALGYLHANCSHCHTEGGVFLAQGPMNMRLSVFDFEREETGVFETVVGAETGFVGGGVTHRINPGDPATSAVNYRMGIRPGMPALGSEIVDEDAVDLMDEWVESLE